MNGHPPLTNRVADPNSPLPGGVKRVLFFDHTAALGGGEIALFNLVRHLRTDVFCPIVLLGAYGTLKDRLLQAGIETHVLPLAPSVLHTRKDSLNSGALLRLKDIARILRYTVKVSRFIRTHRIDIVHTNSLKADIIGGVAARLAGRPVIWHVRDRIESDYLPGPVVKLFRFLCRFVPSYVITNSSATLETLHLPSKARYETVYSGIELPERRADGDSGTGRRLGASRTAQRYIRVVHDGIEAAMWVRATPKPAEPSRPIIGLVGRISPWKGQDVFLRAAKRVVEEFPGAQFQIVGSALFDEEEYEKEIRTLCTDLVLDESVRFDGFQANVSEVISRFSIVVHASTTPEPFGQVIVEGMAAGKPVVATRGGGVMEIVVEGETGLLVEMGDAEGMADAILKLLREPATARQMGENGRRRVEELFTISLTARKVEQVYDQILGTNFTGMTDSKLGLSMPVADPDTGLTGQ